MKRHNVVFIETTIELEFTVSIRRNLVTANDILSLPMGKLT